MPSKPLIFLGADHAGFALKEALKAYLMEKGHRIEDLSPLLVPGDDYPIAAQDVAHEVVKRKDALGVLVCGSGLGMDIAANRIKGARAVVARTITDAKLSRTDDFANILVLGGRITKPAMAKRIVHAWLATPYSTAERHARRVAELDR